MNRRGLPSCACSFLVGSILLTGCSHFERDWRAYEPVAVPKERDEFAPPPPVLPVGRWSGTWTSEANGHHGSLRCLITRVSDHRVRARFRAIFAGFIPYEHSILLDGSDHNGLWRFEGEEDLGWFAGGEFRFNGEASNDRFFASYHTSSDHGTFELNRPNPSGDAK